MEFELWWIMWAPNQQFQRDALRAPLCGDVLALYGVDSDEIAAHAEKVRDLARTGALDAGEPGAEAPQGPAAGPARARIDTETYVSLSPPEASSCSHLGEVRKVLPGATGCEECLAMGDDWVHLRLCMTCGHVGCCDSSRNKHASAHHRATGHPIVRSLEPGEEWGWCYADEVML